MHEALRIPKFIRRPSGATLFVLGFVLFCAVYEYGRVLNLPPFPHHLSRQTTGLSFAYTYWQQGNDLLDPQLQHLFADGLSSGRTVAEFPILYYVIAKLWHFTGPSEFVYRAFMLVLHFLASFALFTLFRRVLQHAGWAAMLALFFFTSPTIVYFAIGFMPDVPSFDLVLIALAVLWSAGVQGMTRWRILLASALFLLAALLKVTALMVPLTILAVLLVRALFRRAADSRNDFFRHKGLLVGCLLLVLAGTAAWYAWSAAFVRQHGVAYSHSGTWALWDLPQEDALRAWTFGKEVLVYQLFDTPAWILFGLLLLFLLHHARHVPLVLWIATVVLAAGTVLYTLLWFITLDAHEYYFIHPIILLMLLAGTALWTLRERYPEAFSSVYLRGAFLLFLGYHVVYAANNHHVRTRGDGPLREGEFLPLLHPAEVAFWDRMQYWTMKPMLSMAPYLRSIGVQQEDLVMCMSDRTVTGALYFLKQRGWVDFAINPLTPEAIDARIKAGASYLLLYEGDWDDRPDLHRFMTRQIGYYKGMRVFDLRMPEDPSN